MIGIWNTVSDVTRCSSTFIRQNKNGNSVSLDCLHGVSPIISNEKRETPSHRECFPLGVVLLCIPPILHRKKGECLVVVHGDPPLPESGVIQRM